MDAIVLHARNPFQPWRDRVEYRLRAPETIAGFLAREGLAFDLPTICLRNGDPVLRAFWETTEVADGDVVAFVSLPQGGGDGSNPLRIVAMIAVSALAGPAAATLGGSLGIQSTIGLAMLKGAIGFVGMTLVNALIPPPKPQGPQAIRELAAASPTYSLNAQGNAARLGSPIPSIYGRHLIYPDFAAQPYAEFAGNEQYLYQLLVVGQGYYDVEAIRIEDTAIENFADVTTELVQPGANVTLFPANVVTSVEVAGQEALPSVALGPFVANSAATQVNYLAIDVVMPKGLYYANDDGSLATRTITWTVEARLINDGGAPLGGWSTIGSESYAAATNTPQRMSYRYAVSPGRYEVRLTRTDTKDTSARAGHDLAWVGLRGYLPGAQSYGAVTLLAVRMRASNQLSGLSSRKVNLIVTRKLPIWSGGGWSAPTATQSIAWALADMCKAEYGGQLVDAQIDLDQLEALAIVWAGRGDKFNAVFDARMGFWEALTTVARAGRAMPVLQGGVVHFVRDAPQTLPVALFSTRNIARNSLRIEYLLQGDQTSDSADVEYVDEATWSQKVVRAVLPGGTDARPARLKGLLGVTNRDQAWREAIYAAAQNRWRRKLITFQTELEGFIPTFGDLIAIAHDLPAWGTSGDVVAWDDGALELTLSEPVTFGAGTHYIVLRERDGSVAGPFECTAGPSDHVVVVSGGLDGFEPQTARSEERTHFAFGVGETYRQRARVTAVRARGELVEIAAVNEDDQVHTAEGGTTPAEDGWSLPTIPTVPTIPYDGANPDSYLSVVMGGTIENPSVTVSWAAAAGADRYYIERSFDGAVWARVADVVDTRVTFVTVPGFQYLRVAPAGAGIGAWRVWSGTVAGGPQVVAPSTPSGLVATPAGLSIILDWAAHGQPNVEFVEILRADTNDSGAAGVIGTVGGSIRSFVDTLASSGLARYYWIRLVNTKGVRGGLSSVATATTSAVGGIEVVAALPVSGLTEGRVVYLTTDKKIYRYNGTVWTAAVDGADILAASVTAQKMAVAQLSAIAADLGAVTAGSLNINNRFVVATDGTVTIQNAGSGARLEIRNHVIKVFDGSGVLRVKLGDLTA